MTECTVCGGETHPAEQIATVYRGTEYQFCSDEHKEEFEAIPETYVG